jgi:alpha-glucosidase
MKGQLLFKNAVKILPFLLFTVVSSGAQNWSVSSPDSAVVIEAKQEVISTISSNKNCYFRILLSGKTLIDWSPIGVKTSDQDFVSNLTFVKDSQAVINETYTLPSGKRSTYKNNCNELTIVFSNANNRQIVFRLRAYNEAAAVRSELHGTGSTTITGEVTGFSLPSGSVYWCHSAFSSDEAPFDQHNVGDATANYAIPILVKSNSNGWALLTEAAVYGDYTGSKFMSNSSTKNIFQVNFIDGQGAISGTLPWILPWRVAIIGKTFGPIVESSVIENLNPPCELTDISWIKPGRCSWSYPTQDNDHSVTLQKHYVDFASQMGWEYNTTDWNFDKSQVPGLVQYANQKNVDEELWYDYNRDISTQALQSSVFPQCHNWGLKCLKIDFISQGEVNCNHSLMQWYDMTAKNLAANKLMATLHGCTEPRGQRRRWPHLLTWESVMGYEYVGRGYGGSQGGPKHNCMVFYTRQVIGPMDLTPVLFTTDQLSNGPGSQRTSTDAHELALSVMVESGLQHFADKPEAYNACIGKPFLQIVPVAWDDIHFIDGNPGESAIVARRKGNDWYVAGIFAGSAKTVTVPLSFLKPGSYTVDLYKDSTGGTKYTMAKQTITINPSTPLSVWIKDNGGFCCRIPNSYQPPVSTIPHSGKIEAQKNNATNRLSLYHLVGGAANGQKLQNGDRIVDIRGKTLTLKNSVHLPQGIFVKKANPNK